MKMKLGEVTARYVRHQQGDPASVRHCCNRDEIGPLLLSLFSSNHVDANAAHKMTSQGDKAIKAEISHRLEQYKRTPLSTSLGAQERRRQAALEVRRRRRDASYSAARGLDAVDDLALPDSDDSGLDYQPAPSKTNKKKKKEKQRKSSSASFANVLQQAELLDSLPEDLDENWMALPWIPSGRRVLARVDWDARYGGA